jgi:hypothetical protein
VVGVVFVVILLAGGRRAFDETGTKCGTDLINESWFQIGSLGGGGERKRTRKEKRKPEAEKENGINVGCTWVGKKWSKRLEIP